MGKMVNTKEKLSLIRMFEESENVSISLFLSSHTIPEKSHLIQEKRIRLVNKM